MTLAAGAALTLALPAAAGAQAPRTATVNLAAVNNSGVTGTATMTDMGGNRTQVVVRLTGAQVNAAGPAHIHDGTCANPNPAPKYPLNNVQNGTSTSEVGASIAELMASPMLVNIHRTPPPAPTDTSGYMTCGNIVAGATAVPSTGGPAGAALPLLGGAGATMAAVAAFVLRRRR
ncbi:MAG: hypothetical protein AVDCRST_MAG77-4595 [uncultured Chloroflexi bacterium]|uniref:CHRD domain-containing protein n=1 Tax=uncultured Chloroflexota bacterium TaxID=166587 RepID=A0A6J4JX83_9CHLR|nr:MAG: hypothetical protein AVDCRST_MAG77-4595 [uncultured Chloroflexota bacterium]